MIVAQLVRTGNFETPLTPLYPFVFVSYVGLRTLKSGWGASCDDLFDASKAINVKQIARDYLNKYIEQISVGDVISQEGSWYFDDANGKIYVHVEHSQNPVCSIFDYGYSFGLSQDELVYIDDYEYLPLILESPDIDRETDYTNSDQPTGSTGTITLSNMSFVNELGADEGILDFLVNEPVWGNDLFLYKYDESTGILTPLAYKYIQDVSIGEDQIDIELQDRRFE